MSWKQFKSVWGIGKQEKRLGKKIVCVDTPDGILHVGNFVNDRPRKSDEYYVVELPGYEMDLVDRLYAQYLIDHPHKDVEVNYTEWDLWHGNKPIIRAMNFGEKSPRDMSEEEYQDWLDNQRY
jgi:hypothetical protein